MVKTINQFKEIFAPIKKKPKPPTKVLAKHKDMLEKNLKDEEWDTFRTDLEKMYRSDVKGSKEYALDLLGYKIAKHIDDDKGEAWVRKVEGVMLNEVAAKVIPNDLSDEATERQYRKAQKSGNALLIKLFEARDGTGMMRLFAKDNATDVSKKIEAGLESGDTEALKQQAPLFESVVLHGDPAALARKNPKVFFEVLLKNVKEADTNMFSRVFKDPKLRAELKAASPTEWAKLAEETPMLAVLDDVDSKMATKKRTGRKDPSAEDQINAVFDAILDPELMNCSYISSSLGYNASDIMSGRTERNKDNLKNITDKTGGMPATDCHNLEHLSRQLVEAALGTSLKADVEIVTSDDGKRRPKNKAVGMVLTRPLSEIKANGLIGSYGGNVFTDTGKATGQVFFTGDDTGENSHSWLIIKVNDSGTEKEIEFDPVLGTRGKAVRQAVAEQGIKWFNQKSKVAAMKGGWYLILNDDIVAGPNKIGITSNYTMTKTKPVDVEKDEETL